MLIGIGIALLLEQRDKTGAGKGLDLTGALVINLCFGLALEGWLITGGLQCPIRGNLVL